MPEMQGLVLQEFTPDAFDAYCKNIIVPALKTSGWTPLGAVLHNTGRIPDWEKISAAQHVRNMSVDWVARNFTGGPHFLVTPTGSIMAVWPAWKRGTHSPSYNHDYWGVEMVGDFTLDPFPDVMRVAATRLLSALYSIGLNKTADETNFHLHKEDPRTTHKLCPGIKCGDKAAWLSRINYGTSAPAPVPVPVHVALMPVPEGTRELIQGFEAFRSSAYLDGVHPDGTPRYAVGWGTNIKPDGTAVVATDTCTREQADAWLDTHIAATSAAIQKVVTGRLTPGVLKSFISFTYEEGIGSFARSAMLAAYNAGDYQEAARQFMTWDKHRDANKALVVSTGIHDRRAKELALWDVAISGPLPPPAPTVKPAPATTPVNPPKETHMDMTNTTPWYKSQTIWGGLQAVVGGSIAVYMALKAGDVGSAVTAGQTVFVAAAGLASAFGGLQAVIGRFKATKMITAK
jgi:lysozyme